jgi:hypothetical protein
MEINKIIKIVQTNKTFEVKIRNILEVEKIKEFIILKYWNPDKGMKDFTYIFNTPITWYDKDGNESTDYKKLVDTLSIYAEQTQLKDAIASLD